MPCDYFLDGARLRLLKDAFFLEEFVNTESHMFLAHLANSILRFRARAKSSSGVARVFLTKPCRATGKSSQGIEGTWRLLAEFQASETYLEPQQRHQRNQCPYSEQEFEFGGFSD